MMTNIEIGPYRVADSLVVYDRTSLQSTAGAITCANGDVVAYYARLADAIIGNEAYFIRSQDHGLTWEMTGEPLASEHEEGAVHVATGACVLGDGTVLLPYADFRSGRLGPNEHPRQIKHRTRPSSLKVAISNDHAHHWQKIVSVNLPQFHWVYPYGHIQVRPDGSLMLPLSASHKCCTDSDYKEDSPLSANAPSTRQKTQTGFILSKDHGHTWSDWHPIVPLPNEQTCVETAWAYCSDGSLLAMHRNTNTAHWLQTRSYDDGQTWSSPEPTSLHGECGCLVSLPNGGLLAAYRSSRNMIEGVPTGMIVVFSSDNGKTWTDEVALDDPKGRKHQHFHETGMPDIIQLKNGKIGIIYYSYDPDLPWRHPINDTAWDKIIHIYKRYIAMAILEEK